MKHNNSRRNQKSSSEFSLTAVTAMNDRQASVLKSKKNLILSGYAGTGKAQPITSKIRVPGGWTTMGDIEIGDAVKCPDNSVSIVLNKYFNSSKDIYRIELADGRSVEACEEHLWEVFIQDSKKPKILTTLDLIEKLSSVKSGKVYLPLCDPISDISEVALPIHPYVLGVLIGDGCLTTGHALFSSADTELVDRVSSFLPENHRVNKTESSDYDHRIVNYVNKVDNKIVSGLSLLGLLGHKSYTKFIPDIYMNQSIENKLLLLQGLMDTDGSVDTRSSIEYSTSSELLAQQIAELIRSLGGYCSIASRMGRYRDKNGSMKETVPNYRLIPSRLPFDIKKRLFSLTRKVDRLKPGQYDATRKIRVVKVDFVREEDCWCIEIDHPKHLYLTDQYIVTHNTFLASYLAYRDVLINNNFSKVIYMRSAVPTRNIGFLPGTDKEKIEVYEAPYIDIATELFGRGDSYDILKKKSYVHFSSTSFVRGINLRDAFIIVDETQNMDYHELDSILTRLNDNCRIAFCGDIRQADLFKNGMSDFYRVLREMPNEFDFIEFGKEDIVRSELVKNYIITKDKVLNKF